MIAAQPRFETAAPPPAGDCQRPEERTEPYKDFWDVHDQERGRLGIAKPVDIPAGKGLALSGGGIRSASFALGALQHLLNKNLLRHFDYLSTVSGGGYLGSAASWWAHHAANLGAPIAAQPQERYQAFSEQFGSRRLGARTDEPLEGPSPLDRWTGSNWLAYLRQHGNYLQPPRVGWLSIFMSVVRPCIYNILVYLAALIVLLGALNWPAEGHNGFWYCGVLSGFLGVVLLLMLPLIYGPITWGASTFPLNPEKLYAGRTWVRQKSGVLLGLALAALVLWSVPVVGKDIPNRWGISIWHWASSATGLGAIGAVYQFFQGRARTRGTPSILGELRVVGTSALVLYGLLLGAYAFVCFPGLQEYQWDILIVSSIVVVFFGFAVNLNYEGIGRLYRDRLMETFLPNPGTLRNNTWSEATDADRLGIACLTGRITREGDLESAKKDECQRPLQLVNCNVVLLDSDQDIYRTRGGDSFCISSLYSGSNSTGWVETNKLGDEAVTLATAMSISGAAVNPDAAPNGHGVTRNKMVSFLMTVFSLGLGYWMPNPKHHFTRYNRPNLWWPGFWHGLLGRGLTEDARFLELSDGGHFDNTGVYELVRRRTQIIVLVEAGYDPQCKMDDLANVIEKVRVDFSVFIDFEDASVGLQRLRYKNDEEASAGFAIGRIRYPNLYPERPGFTEGYLIYLQSVPISAMPADVKSYRRQHPEFPSDPTSDQFFDEPALEAYRELGYTIAGEFSSAVAGVTCCGPYLDAVRNLFSSVPRSPSLVSCPSAA